MKTYELDWDKHKSGDGEINLFSAYSDYFGEDAVLPFDFLHHAGGIYPIYSRQVASLALATARELV
jgi:hypothetical protein